LLWALSQQTSGANISATAGVYPAELQAIPRALTMFPLSCSFHIHSDSQAAMVGWYLILFSDFACMSARPLLQLIHHQLTQQNKAGGTVQFDYVQPYTIIRSISIQLEID
jgi:hypothetical protein